MALLEYSREYTTGVTRHLKMEANLTLHLAGGVYAMNGTDSGAGIDWPGIPPAPYGIRTDGWTVGSAHLTYFDNGLNILDTENGGGGTGNYYQRGIIALPFQIPGDDAQVVKLELRSYLVYRREGVGFGGFVPIAYAVTEILFNGVVLKDWIYDEAAAKYFDSFYGAGTLGHAFRQETAPADIAVSIVMEFDAEEAIREYDAFHTGSILDLAEAPSYVGDPAMSVILKSTSDISVTIAGEISHTETVALPRGTVVDDRDAAFVQMLIAPEIEDGPQFPHTPGSPYFQYSNTGATIAECDTLQFNGGTIALWEKGVHTASQLPINIANLTHEEWSYDSYTAENAVHGSSRTGKLQYDATITAELVDMEDNALTNIPATFKNGDTTETATPISATAHLTDAQNFVPRLNPPADYTVSDKYAPVYRYGAVWNSLTVDRPTLTLAVEDFSTAADWTPTDASAPSYATNKLSVTGSGDHPSIKKTLDSDFETLAAMTDHDRHAWWAARITAAEVSSLEQAWWNSTGKSIGGEHVGDWYKIGKSIKAGSDKFNWSAYRYLIFRASSYAPTAVKLKLEWDEIIFSGEEDVWPSVNRTNKTAEFTIDLTTTPTDYEIDLPSRCGQTALRYVKSITISFSNGQRIFLESLTLKAKTAAEIALHHPIDDLGDGAGTNLITGDIGIISALSDGKHALFLSSRQFTPPNSVWGWPGYKNTNPLFGSSRNAFRNLTVDELAAEIGLQEGWTASVAGAPTNGTPNYSVFIKDKNITACPVTFSSQRCFGHLEIYLYWAHVFSLHANLGHGAFPIAFDKDTLIPADNATILLTDNASAIVGNNDTTLDTETSDSTGTVKLYAHKAAVDKVKINAGTPDESILTDTTYSRTWWPVFINWKPDNQLTTALDFAMNAFGRPYLSEAGDNYLRIFKDIGRETSFEGNNVLTNIDQIFSPSRAIREDHFHLLGGIQDDIAKLWRSDNEQNWTTYTVTTIANNKKYKALLIRQDPGNKSKLHCWLLQGGAFSTAFSSAFNGTGGVWHTWSVNGGLSWANPPINVTTIKPGRAARGDIRHLGAQWFRAHPATDDSIRLLTSVDGEGWTDIGLITGHGLHPWLVSIKGGFLCIYDNGTDLVCRRGRFRADGGWVWSDEFGMASGTSDSLHAAFATGQKVVAARRTDTIHFFVSYDFGDTWTEGSEG